MTTEEMTAQATSSKQDGGPTKVCPSCGATLFADMNICYGCLYDFTKTYEPPQIGVADEVPVEVYEQLPQPQAKNLEGLENPAAKTGFSIQENQDKLIQAASDSAKQTASVLHVCGPSVNLSFGCSNQGIRLLAFKATSQSCEGVGLDKGTKINMGDLVFTVQ